VTGEVKTCCHVKEHSYSTCAYRL